jgi:hypothetical protein
MTKSKKTPPVTKGPGGEPVDMPKKPSKTDRLRGAAEKLIKFCEQDFVDGDPVYYMFDVINKLTELGYEGETYVTQMLQMGYLVPRTKSSSGESFFVFTSYKKGVAFRANNKTAN